MKELTERQRAVLRILVRFTRENGYSPTIRETGAALGIRSANTASEHLRALEKKGYLTRGRNKFRALVPTALGMQAIFGPQAPPEPAPTKSTAIPVLNSPTRDCIRVDPRFLDGAEDLVAVPVRGDAMIDAGILDGDYVFVKKQPTAIQSSFVVTAIDGESVVRRFKHTPTGVSFETANEAVESLFVPKAEAAILGVVIGLYRKL